MFYFEGTRKPNFKDIKSLDYDSYWKFRGFSLNKKLKERELIILEAIPADSVVIDIGCGNSLLPVKLKEKGCSVSVGDLSSIVLDGYREQRINGQKIDLSNTENIKLEQKYDWVIMSEVLEHLAYPEVVISNLKNYTRNFAITIPNSGFYRYRIHLFFFGRFFTQWAYHPSEHLRFWTHTDFLDWLQAMGLRVRSTKASNGLNLFGLQLFQWWPNLFGHQICYFVEVK
jgi:methionine biosynthesis protein MetW